MANQGRLDIVQLIEKNSKTRLTKEYESRLIQKIKGTFTDTQQHLFVSSFYCYLQYHPKNDFVIDFDEVWKWLGFSRKDNAKRNLDKYFVTDVDYKIEMSKTEVFAPESGGAKTDTRGGHNKEKISLSVHTFKKFCMKADTKKADEIHEYYIKLEELFHETMNEESDELKKQLDVTSKQKQMLEIENKNLAKHIIRRKELKYKAGNCLYIIASDEIKDKVKIGMTQNINHRLMDLNTGSPEKFKLVEVYFTPFNASLEKMIKEVFASLRISTSCEWYKRSGIADIQNVLVKILDVLEPCNKFAMSKRSERVSEYKKPEVVKEQEVTLIEEQVETEIELHTSEDEEEQRNDLVPDLHVHVPTDYVHEEEKRNDLVPSDVIVQEEEEKRNDLVPTVQLEMEDKIVEIGTNKRCIECSTMKHVKNFFFIDRSQRLYVDQCMECHEKINGPSKQCTDCAEIKPGYQFQLCKTKVDGLTYDCRDCRAKKTQVIRDEHRKRNLEIGKKKCGTCSESFELRMFYRKKEENIDSRLRPKKVMDVIDDCKTCYNKAHDTTKQCAKCHDIKNADEFMKSHINRTGLYSYCKSCTKQDRKKDIEAYAEKNAHVNEKQCTTCHVEKNFSDFFRNTKPMFNLTPYHDSCKACEVPNISDVYQCNRCDEIKNLMLFSYDKTKENGRRTICKDCTNLNQCKRPRKVYTKVD